MARDPEDSLDPYAPLDFSEVETALAAENNPDLAAWAPAGRAFIPLLTAAAITKADDDAEDQADEDDEAEGWDPFQSNEAQSRFRAAVRTWDYDTAFAAGTISSSKTYGIAALIVELCLEYPETRVMVVRTKRESLEDATIPDFELIYPPGTLKAANKSKLDHKFANGSMIQFRAALEQTDPKAIWLRGKKFDIGFVDECDGVSEDFMSAFQSRIGIQRKRSRKSIPICPPICFLACNPNIAWPKKYYSLATHAPDKLKRDRFYFQRFTIEDNAAHITEEKKAQWRRLMTPPMYRRFVLGSWDAMSDREQLFLFEDMDKCRPYIPEKVDAQGNKTPWKFYLGVDPAGYGPDKCAFLVMKGPNLWRMEFHMVTSQVAVADYTKRLMAEYGISPDHVTMDADGLGAGAVDILAADHIFINAHKGSAAADNGAFYLENPLDPSSKIHMDNAAFTFYNKRASAHWEAMQLLRMGGIGNFDTLGFKAPCDEPMPGEEGVDRDEINLDDTLRADMAAIHYGFAKGSKAIIMESKEDIKKRLHRSPDFSDVLVNAIQSYLHDSKKPSMEVFSF